MPFLFIKKIYSWIILYIVIQIHTIFSLHIFMIWFENFIHLMSIIFLNFIFFFSLYWNWCCVCFYSVVEFYFFWRKVIQVNLYTAKSKVKPLRHKKKIMRNQNFKKRWLDFWITDKNFSFRIFVFYYSVWDERKKFKFLYIKYIYIYICLWW